MDNDYNTVTGDKSLICGIYIMVNKTNGKTYVGQSKRNVYYRSRCHSSDVHNELGKCIRENGFSIFDLSLYLVDRNYLDENEAMWIKELECIHPNGYNLDPSVNIRSWETMRRMSIGMKGIKKGSMSEEHKRKIRDTKAKTKARRLFASYERQRIMGIERSKRQVGYILLNTNKGAHYE